MGRNLTSSSKMMGASVTRVLQAEGIKSGDIDEEVGKPVDHVKTFSFTWIATRSKV